MNKQTKLMALILSVLMLLAMLPISATAEALSNATGAAVSVTSESGETAYYATFEEAWTAAKTGDTIKLLANCVVNPASQHARGFQSNNRDLTVDLNGFVMSQASGTTTRFFHIKQPSTLTIKDSNPTAVHKYTKDATTGLYVWDDTAGTIEIPGGAITGGYAGVSGSHTQRGGAIYLQGGCLKVEGGNFIGNRAIKEGGVVATTAIWYDSDQTDWTPSIKISGGLFVGNATDNDDQDTFGGTYVTQATFAKDSYAPWTESYISGGIFSDALLGGFNGDNAVAGKGVKAIMSEGYSIVAIAGDYGYSTLYAARAVVEVDGVSHSMVVTSAAVDPDCDTDGKTEARKCELIHDGVACTYTDGGVAVPALGHTTQDMSAIAATCVNDGRTAGKRCTVCNEAVEGMEVIPATGHTPGEWTVAKEATADAAGLEAKKCTVCGAVVEKRDIAALGAETTAATETETAAAEETGGCGSVIGGSIGFAVAATVGTCVLCRKKKED